MTRTGSASPRTPTAQRVHRLRIQLTLLFSALASIGLVLLTTVAISADAQTSNNAIDNDLRRATTSALAVIGVTAGRFDVTALTNDDGTIAGDTDLYVISGPTGATGAAGVAGGAVDATLVFQPRKAKAPVDAIALSRTSAGDEEAMLETDTAIGDAVRARVVPTNDENGQAVGSLVAVRSLRQSIDAHRRFTLVVWVGAATLVLASALAGYAIAGRSTGPATAAIEQQERFLSAAAHELRTPLTGIRATLEAALMREDHGSTDGEGHATLVQSVRGALTQAEHTSTMVDDLLLLARADAQSDDTHMEPLQLDQLVRAVTDTYPGVGVITQPAVVVADAMLVRRATDNLLRNALAHGNGLGIEVSVEVGPEVATVRVADRGPGIDPKVLPDIFDRFVARRASNGSGLGLSIVEWVARAHGGSATAVNRDPGPGAAFTFTLPVH